MIHRFAATKVACSPRAGQRTAFDEYGDDEVVFLMMTTSGHLQKRDFKNPVGNRRVFFMVTPRLVIYVYGTIFAFTFLHENMRKRMHVYFYGYVYLF